MRITVSQLQTRHGILVDALKRGEKVELTYHGKVLGVVHPQTEPLEEYEAAIQDFFCMHKDLGTPTVEQELRHLRKGRFRKGDF